MSKHNNNSGSNGKTPQPTSAQTNAVPAQTSAAPNPGEERFRRETAEAMEGDLMTVGALAPDSVAVALPTPPANVPKIVDESDANSGQEQGQGQQAQAAAVPESTQILALLQAGKIDVDQCERLLCALKNVQPATAPALPYIGGSDGPATREEILAAVKEVYGAELAAKTKDKTEMLEVMGAMVENIVTRLREPSAEDKLALERKKRDRARTIREQLEMIQQQHDFKKMCPHERATADGKSHTTVSALHNYIDNVLRGTCGICQNIIEPGQEGYRQVIMQHNLAVSN